MKQAQAVAVAQDERDGVVHVRGALNISSASLSLETAARIFDQRSGPLVFDLSGLTDCDSAALAVLLEWLRHAERAGRELSYRNAPERLRQLARISDLESALPMSDAAA